MPNLVFKELYLVETIQLSAFTLSRRLLEENVACFKPRVGLGEDTDR